MLVVPITLIAVALCGALCGGALPLLFRRLGLDPALMSNPFVSGICDVAGIMIYMAVALLLLPQLSGKVPYDGLSARREVGTRFTTG